MLKIREREIYRYLGYKGKQPDNQIKCLVQEIVEELQKVITPRSIFRECQCRVEENARVVFWDTTFNFSMKSVHLANNLKNCSHVIFFAATIGNTPDSLMKKYEITNMTKALILQATAAEFVEAYCDEIQEKIKKQKEIAGYYLRPRFSPGYGDLSIENQKEIFQILECEKRIGLTLTDSYLMVPTKSVTALIGITTDQDNCHVGKCKNCLNTECEFRDENNG